MKKKASPLHLYIYSFRHCLGIGLSLNWNLSYWSCLPEPTISAMLSQGLADWFSLSLLSKGIYFILCLNQSLSHSLVLLLIFFFNQEYFCCLCSLKTFISSLSSWQVFLELLNLNCKHPHSLWFSTVLLILASRFVLMFASLMWYLYPQLGLCLTSVYIPWFSNIVLCWIGAD